MQNTFAKILPWFFPPLCVHCNREGDWLCAITRQSLAAEPVYPEMITLPGIDHVFIRGSYDCTVLQKTIHKIKYSYWSAAKEILPALISPLRPQLQLLPSRTVIVPVPLHTRRQRERGFNQALLISRALHEITGWPVQPLLARQRYTKPQAQLTEQARRQNVVNAFRSAVKLEQIPSSAILVDDVLTTGSTLIACAKILRQQGVSQVSVCTLAKG